LQNSHSRSQTLLKAATLWTAMHACNPRPSAQNSKKQLYQLNVKQLLLAPQKQQLHSSAKLATMKPTDSHVTAPQLLQQQQSTWKVQSQQL
jgi:hypothetical protein